MSPSSHRKVDDDKISIQCKRALARINKPPLTIYSIVGKRGSRSRKRPGVHERRAHKHAQSEAYHKHRANIIGNSIIVAAIWTVGNILAYGYGVLPYPYSYFAAFQMALFLGYGTLAYIVLVWNRRCPVYRETFWMIIMFTLIGSTITSWPVV